MCFLPTRKSANEFLNGPGNPVLNFEPAMSDPILRLLEGDFSLLEDSELNADLVISEKALNAYLRSLTNDQLRKLKVDLLPQNRAKISFEFVAGVCFARKLWVEITQHPKDPIITLHIRKGLKLFDGVPLQVFQKKINQLLPHGVRFVLEFEKDRFTIDLRMILSNAGLGNYFALVDTFQLSTEETGFRLVTRLAHRP